LHKQTNLGLGVARQPHHSIINKTPISYKANRMIGGRAPSTYLAAIQGHKQVTLSDAQMDAILASHLIEPSSLRANDFDAFHAKRAKLLLSLIQRAMGKEVHHATVTPDDLADNVEAEAA
jgi:hypothetical protein